MPRPVALLIAACLALPLAAAVPAQAQGPAALVGPPAIAAITDLHSGPEPSPIAAVWRDDAFTNRFHLVTSSDIDLEDWVVRLTAIGWRPSSVRVTMVTNKGIPTSAIATLQGEEATPSGSAATAIEDEGVSIDLPGRPTSAGGLHVRTLQQEDVGTAQVAMTPIDVNQMTNIPYGGLRTPVLPLTLDPKGAPRANAGPLAAGPAVSRTSTGIRITVIDPPPTEVAGVAVDAVTDTIVVRATDDLRAPVALSLIVGADAVTALDEGGKPLAIDGAPWQAALRPNPDTDLDEVDITLLQMASLVGATLDERSRIGVVRDVELADGSRVLADGLDVRYEALRAGRADNPAEVDPTGAETGKVTMLIAAGVLAMFVVLGPLVRFSVQARRERRQRPTL